MVFGFVFLAVCAALSLWLLFDPRWVSRMIRWQRRYPGAVWWRYWRFAAREPSDAESEQDYPARRLVAAVVLILTVITAVLMLV